MSLSCEVRKVIVFTCSKLTLTKLLQQSGLELRKGQMVPQGGSVARIMGVVSGVVT